MLLQSVPNPDYMNGTMSLSDSGHMGVGPVVSRTAKRARRAAAMNGTMAISSTRRMALDSEGMGCGNDYTMGTTGSLGVSFAAPLTRGGFKGEIFDTAPMPTGSWKDAPTPVMLGTGTGMKGTGGFSFFSLVGIVVTGLVYYGAYQYYFGKGRR